MAGSPATVEQGQSATINVAVARTSPFAGPVALTLEGAPAGMAASFSPTSVASGATASVLTLDVGSSVAAATYPLTIRAKGQGVTDATAALSVVVTAPPAAAFALTLSPSTLSIATSGSGTTTATITRSGGFAGPVALAVTGAPAGVVTSEDPSPVTGGTSTIHIAVASTVTPGTYNLTVTGTGTGVANQTATLALTVTAAQVPSFGMTLSPTAVSMAQGASATTTATIARAGGFTGAVAVAVTGAPAGITATPSPTSVTGNTSTITVAASATAVPGTYSLTVTGTGTGVSNQTATLSVTVTSASAGAFTLVLAPTGLSVAQGASGTSTATITRSGGFTGAVGIAVTGAPAGVTVTPNPTSITTGTTSTITVAVAASVAAGTYNLTVTGTGTGVATKTATLTLSVTAASAGAITLALSPTALTVAQGASGTTTATIARSGGFTGAVGIAVTGAPTGVTVTPSPASITTGTTSTITVAVGSSVAAGTYTLTVTGTGTGITNKTATLTLTVTAASAGAFTLALSPTTLSVVQGASGTSTATIARSGGFTGAVGLAVTGAPTGLTVTLNPASVTGTSSTITVAAASTLAAGTYTLTVTGTGTGVTNKTATLTVNVTAGSSQTGTYAFCADNVPTWFAIQNGPGAAWTRVTPTGNSFTFHFTASKVGIAYVTTSTSSGSDLSVLYATSAEVTGSGGTTNVECTSGGKTVHGSVANVGAGELATIALASSTASVFGGTGNTFDLTGLPEGAHDLIASRATQTITGSDFTTAVNRLIIRRGINPAAGSTMSVLDFGSAESFAPATATMTIGNLGADQALVSVGLNTANGTSASFFSSTSATATATYYGVPDAKLASGDLHEVTALAFPGGTATTSRFATQYFRSVSNRTVTLGATLGVPTITTVATSPYLRLRAQLTSHAEYNRLGGIVYEQGTGATARAVTVIMTAAYAGGAVYDLTIPDLSAASGWSNAWGLQAGVSTDWTEIEAGGSFNFFFPGARPSDGSTVVYASRTGTIASP